MQTEQIVSDWLTKAYPAQELMFTERNKPYRNYLVERHRGTTYAMAIESLVMQRETERLQVVVGATIQQAKIVRHYLDQLYGRKVVDFGEFMFISAATFPRFVPSVPFDLYVMDYLYLPNPVLGSLAASIDPVEGITLVRQTWYSALPPDPRLQLLAKARSIKQLS